MTRLRSARRPTSGAGRRRRAGKGFIYLDEAGEPPALTTTAQRVRDLVIPPAWQDVWI